MELKCKINGEEVTLRAEPTARLRDVLYRAGYRSVRDSDDAEGFAGSDTIVFDGSSNMRTSSCSIRPRARRSAPPRAC